MAAAIHACIKDCLPCEETIRNAEQLRQIVASLVRDGEAARLSLLSEDSGTQTIALTPALEAALQELLGLISSGRGVRLIPVEAELTTEQAAELLNVPRPFLAKLLDDNTIRYFMSGCHRRIRASDLFSYMDWRDQTRSEALRSLARMDAESGLL